MPIKQAHRCEKCAIKKESTRKRVVLCGYSPGCGCDYPSERPEMLCDGCAKGRKESS